MTKKLLVVEDSKAIANVIKQIGQSVGFEVTIAESIAQLEDVLQGNQHYFAATIDYSLPDGPDGEAIECVLSRRIPGIVMTGKMDDETRQKILSQPVVDYIPKENSQAYMYLKRILSWLMVNNNIGILVVDDSRASRNYIVELLKRRNYTVYIADSGKKALEILKQSSNIKMVITDLEMPEMDGIALTNEIRRHFSRENIAIIGVSGAETGSHTARFIKNGADDFLRKPFCLEEFYCRITQHIENIDNIERIKQAALTDYLTELPNRRAFFQQAEGCIQRFIKKQTSYCLAMLDIDFFKKVNDTYGHDAGDHILKITALYLRRYFGSGLVARLGGEEFVILFAGSDEHMIQQKLNEFRLEIANNTMPYEEKEINFTVSIGVVFNSQAPLTVQLNLADEALYKAKAGGRNKIVEA
ncbi:diguanylate cyclase [Thalassotalea ganghwensis]